MLDYLKKALKIILLSLVLISLSNIILNLSLKYDHDNFSNSYTENIVIDDIVINYYQDGVGTPLLIINDIFNTINDYSYFTSISSNIISINLVELLNNIPSEYSDNYLSNLLFKFMSELGYDKFNVLAFSSSNKIALDMASSNNTSLEKLILVNPKEYTSKDFLLNNYIYQKLLYTKNYWNSSLINKQEFEYNYFLLKSSNKKNLHKYLYFLNSLNHELKNINNNILIISNTWELKYSSYLNNEISSSSLIEILNCGEVPYIEANEIFTEEINLFLR